MYRDLVMRLSVTWNLMKIGSSILSKAWTSHWHRVRLNTDSIEYQLCNHSKINFKFNIIKSRQIISRKPPCRSTCTHSYRCNFVLMIISDAFLLREGSGYISQMKNDCMMFLAVIVTWPNIRARHSLIILHPIIILFYFHFWITR